MVCLLRVDVALLVRNDVGGADFLLHSLRHEAHKYRSGEGQGKTHQPQRVDILWSGNEIHLDELFPVRRLFLRRASEILGRRGAFGSPSYS